MSLVINLVTDLDSMMENCLVSERESSLEMMKDIHQELSMESIVMVEKKAGVTSLKTVSKLSSTKSKELRIKIDLLLFTFMEAPFSFGMQKLCHGTQLI